MSAFFSSKRGFLFTISVIFFASTLVLYAQSFYQSTITNERLVITATQGAGTYMLADDAAQALAELMGVTIDVNQYAKKVLITGVLTQNPSVATALTDYNAFVVTNVFPRMAGDERILLDTVRDGVAELALGEDLALDINYLHSVGVFYSPTTKAPLVIDLNIHSTGTLTGIEWSEGAGSVVLRIMYTDDANTFSLTKNVTMAGTSVLTLVYADTNTRISFGDVLVSGAAQSNAVAIEGAENKRIEYSLQATYASLAALPVRWNAYVHTHTTTFDATVPLTLLR